MSVVKAVIKAIFRAFLKIRMFFHKKKTYPKDEGSAERLNELYPLKAYDLSQSFRKGGKYLYDLSIIVPVYNSEKYLKQCLDSLLNQKTEYSYEIICIDDGSSDSSSDILDSYHNEHLYVIHQDNMGISGARNIGLNASRGKYVGFVDNDDYVDYTYVDRLLKSAYGNDLDYLKCSYEIFNEEKIIEQKQYKDAIKSDMNETGDYSNWLHGYMWGGCYKAEIWEGFCFPTGYWYEDMIRNLYLYDCCKKIGSISDIIYHKRQHDSNAAVVLWKKEDIKCLDQLYLIKELDGLKKQRKITVNNLSKKALLIEISRYLYNRTSHLKETTRKDIFMEACELYSNQSKTDFDNFVEKKTYQALINRDYQLYEIVGKYYRWK